MAFTRNARLSEHVISVPHSTFGTQTGALSPPMGGLGGVYINRIGLTNQAAASTISSNVTLSVVTWDATGSTVALAATALGSAVPPGNSFGMNLDSPIYIPNQTDGFQIVSSGGPTSALGAQVYAWVSKNRVLGT